ncbi:ABC transporter ATP-binding protein [Kaistia dalseonensis]|uniref:ABC-type branched-subunit amino acid transport system ATPase component n=1 Tax=Kaistia dalseonensis TaxID=410840 RepID=A0ABU0H5G5_9HYPH|nr:ABC transporter ATP-binding protein [Kaistia dalseonensis]MCX5494954.1 ABC transporter ATP-binding protein [Kaistia dalseonensis]MDQ0437535.1 ABC-type branched-subunit amino acid transport system ATPase component [Kaistia dalseonensis]
MQDAAEGNATSGGAPFLEIISLVKSFGGVRAVDHVDLVLDTGAMRCIIGPNGCGKTTLFNLITGYLPPSSGDIRYRGQSIVGRPLHKIAADGIVRKFQVPSVFPEMTVEDNIRAAAGVRHGRSVASPAELLDMVGLTKNRRHMAGTLSHGEKQWLELAMVLSTAPRLILLDEPAAGMTRTEKTETVRLIHEIRRETNVAALVIEHDMAFVAALDCPISVMMLGRIVASGDYDTVRRDPLVREAYLGAVNG